MRRVLLLLLLLLVTPAHAQFPPLAVALSMTASDLVRGQVYTATASIWTDADDRVTLTLVTPPGVLITHVLAQYGCLHGTPPRQAALHIDAASNGLAIAIGAEGGCQATIAYLLQVADDAPAGMVAQVQLLAHDERGHRAAAQQSVRVNRTDLWYAVWVPIVTNRTAPARPRAAARAAPA